MNNKVLIAVIVIILLVGGFFLLNRNYPTTSQPTSSRNTQTAPTPQTNTPQVTSPTPTQQTQNTVTLTTNGFSPATLTIKVGQTVTWINKSGEGATVNSDPHPVHTTYPPLNLGNFPDGGTFTLTFDKPGTYGYHNHLNPSERGTITVQ